MILNCTQCGAPFSRQLSVMLASNRGKYCSRQCWRDSKGTALDRLMKGRHITESGCWEWTKATDTRGYGKIAFNGKLISTHRLSAHLLLAFDLDPRVSVCHRCDNPPCFNPEHLFLGSMSDNMTDASAKGRSSGMARPESKVTDEQVREIRARHSAGETQRSISKDYELTFKAVNRIVLGKTWKHLL